MPNCTAPRVAFAASHTCPASRASRASRAPIASLAAGIAAAAAIAGPLAGASPAAAASASGLGGSPDLRIAEVDAAALVSSADGSLVSGPVSVRIVNDGSGDAAGPVELVLFEDATDDPANTLGRYDAGLDRVVGAASVAAGLPAGDSVDLPFMLDDQPTLFRDNLLYAAVDPDDLIAETDEDNNVGASAADCAGPTVLPTFEPVVAWHWNPLEDPDYAGDPAFADWVNVMVTPAIGDVTGPAGVPDGVPDVVFPSTSNAGGGASFAGVLRVVDGQTGREWYSVTDPDHRVIAACSPAIGDLDGDGLPEIVCAGFPGGTVRVFEHDGTFKFDSAESNVLQGFNAVALANVDPPGVDPLPEVIARARVIDRNGQTRWTGSIGAGGSTLGSGIAYAADYDLDGAVEVFVGGVVYDANGTIEHALQTNHFSAVANFDADDQAEIVTVGGGFVRLYDDDGTLIWGPLSIPGGGQGGPPTIADFDNDGAPEIGTAGSVRYIVVEGTGPDAGTIRWEREINDTSSNRTGSSVFDFEGDGFADVVYRDQNVLYLMDGATGTDKSPPLAISSCTWTEYVQVADVDADAHAEIVAVANTSCGFGPEQGVFVLENLNDDWVNTRRVWNQHAYSITNVNDDLTIPDAATPNWQFPAADPFNNFRQNLPSSGVSALARADLTVSRPRIVACEQPGITILRARIGNGGAALANVVVTVSAYDPAAGPNAGPIGSADLTQALTPGGFVDLEIPLDVSLPPNAPIAIVVDAGSASYGDVLAQLAACGADPASASIVPDAGLDECRECNNVRTAASVPGTCPGDVDCNGAVEFVDLLRVLNAWGACPAAYCIEDLTGDGTIAFPDLLTVLSVWGPCPEG
ncbi:MAG: FG-GAP-like repeat-containing protein [Phycisphaerales bacterium]